MRRLLPAQTFAAPAFLCMMALIGSEARGQAEDRGFHYAQPKDTPKVAKSTKVHKDRTELTRLDTWIVKQSSLPAANHRAITAIVEDITLYSNGTMRWKYAIYNKGSSGTNFIFDFPSCYVVDEEGNLTKATAWEKTQNYGTMTKVGLPAEAKTEFWIEYDAPSKVTKNFKVGLIFEGGFSTLPNEIAPFRVTLADPISLNVGKAEPPRAEANPAGVAGLEVEVGLAPELARPGGMTRAPDRPGPVIPKPLSMLAQAVLAAPGEGRCYEGNIEAASGGHAVGGIQFERRAKDRLLSARIYIKSGSKKEIKLVGAICEAIGAPGGFVFRFEDLEEVEYLFHLDGNTLSGKDTVGNRYAFTYRKR